MDTDDSVLRQLRKLREGPGLTTNRLAGSGAVMSALGTSDPEEARQRLIGALAELGDTERAKALKVDLGVGLDDLIGREPVSREREWLGDRRSAYADVAQRDVKTLGRWSDRAIAELRGYLITDTFAGHLFVVAAVEGDRILGVSLIQQPLDEPDDAVAKRTSIELPNKSAEPSMPCVVYGYPRDWRPASLTFAVVFRSEPYPAEIWSTVADNLLNLAYGEERYALELNGDTATCRFVRPRRDRVYGVWWSGVRASTPNSVPSCALYDTGSAGTGAATSGLPVTLWQRARTSCP